MANTLTQMYAGMQSYFLSLPWLTAEIESRFWELGDPSFMALFEGIREDPAASHGKFITYRDAGEMFDRVKGGESRLRIALVEMTCFGKFAGDARELRELMLRAIGGSLTTTWAGVSIKNANWMPGTQSMDFDDTVMMSTANCTLKVPYLNN